MSNIAKNLPSKIILAISACFTVAGLTGCMQSIAAATDHESFGAPMHQEQITDDTLKVVNAAFFPSFITGDWQYKGARNQGGSINAYIQIPQALDMSKEVQQSYLKNSICPSAQHKNMWRQIKGTQLAVHLYIHKQKQSIYAHCENPLAKEV